MGPTTQIQHRVAPRHVRELRPREAQRSIPLLPLPRWACAGGCELELAGRVGDGELAELRGCGRQLERPSAVVDERERAQVWRDGLYERCRVPVRLTAGSAVTRSRRRRPVRPAGLRGAHEGGEEEVVQAGHRCGRVGGGGEGALGRSRGGLGIAGRRRGCMGRCGWK